MFDPTTRGLIAGAPNLPGLDAVTLTALLTEAHIAIVSARLSVGTETKDNAGEDGGRRAATLHRVRRMVSTFEAYVALDIRPDQARAAAFVAASTHAIMAWTVDRRPGRPALLSSDAIDAALSSRLLFLLAERTADAAEAATRLLARDEPRAVRRSLILSVRKLARA